MHQNYLKGMNDYLKVNYLKGKALYFSYRLLYSIGAAQSQRLRTMAAAWEY